MSGRIRAIAQMIRIEWEDQHGIAVSCARCGGVAQIWGYDLVELLPWRVIEHLLSEHWDGAHDPALVDGHARP